MTDIYYIAFPTDKLQLKAVVCLAYSLEIVQVAVAAHDCFKAIASGWGNLLELDAIRLDWFSVPMLTAISTYLRDHSEDIKF